MIDIIDLFQTILYTSTHTEKNNRLNCLYFYEDINNALIKN